ncbi:MAG: hypothetical protein J6S40_02185, partial [Thermoguttaceae bacterium]|nr:hypothetical protein [Thermoguttaceae bacterium]
TVRALITPAEFTVTLTGYSGVYDGDAHSVTVSGTEADDIILYSLDAENYTADQPEFTDAGTHKVYVKVQRANHSDWTGSASVTITPAELTVRSVSVETKTYDGTTDANILSYVVTGFVNTEDEGNINVDVTGEFANAAAGTQDVNLAYTITGTGSENYTVSLDSAAGEIGKRQLTLNFTASDKVYDSTTAADVEFAGYIGLIDGDDVSVAITVGSAFESANAGERAVDVQYVIYGGDLANYDVAESETKATITPRQITVSGTTVENKIYDGDTGATVNLGTVSGILNGEVTVTAAGTFADPNTGLWDVAVTYTLAGNENGNYTAPDGETIRALITPAGFTVDFDDDTATYDGTGHSISVDEADLEDGDVVLYSLDAETYSAELPEFVNAGTYKVYAKVQRANYADWTGSAELTVNPLQLTISGTTVESKAYDGTTAATVIAGELTNLVEGDQVTVTATGEFTTAGVGTWAVPVTYAISGAQSGNYLAPVSELVNGEIYAAAGDYSFAGGSVVYDGAQHGFLLGGVQEGDVITYTYDGQTSTEMPTFRNVGTYEVSVTVQRAGYEDWTGSAELEITPRQITVSGSTVDNKVYDATTAAVIHLGTVSGVVAGDDVAVTASGEFEDSAVGDYVVTVNYALSGDAGAVANYTLATASSADEAKITKRTITVTGTKVDDRYYDGTRDAQLSGYTLSGVAGTDTVTVTATGLFDTASAGMNKDVEATYELDDASKANYELEFTTQTLSGTILKKEISVASVDVKDKVYDMTVDAEIVLGDLVGKVTGDDVAITASGAFASPNVGVYDVTVTYALTGDDADNYVLAVPYETDEAEITKAPVTVTGTTANDKTYDGSTEALLHLGTVHGLIAGDEVTFNHEGTFSDKNVGEDKDVSVSYWLTGDSAGNYDLQTTSETLTADITPRLIYVYGAQVQDKVYDGTTAATVTIGGLFNLVEGDDVTGGATTEFTGKDVGVYNNLEITYTITGADAGNYELMPTSETGSASITPRQLTITGTYADDKIYDGDRTATVHADPANLGNLVSGETVELTASGLFDTPDVGQNKDVTVTYTVDDSNYIAPVTEIVKASIIADELGIIFNDQTFTYDGELHSVTVEGALTTDTVLYSVDGETYSAQIPAYTDAGVYKVYAKVSRDNYSDWTGSATLTINKRQLTISGTEVTDKVYDGTTAAEVTAGALGNIVSGEESAITVTALGRFADKNAGDDKDVTVAYVISGDAAKNYIVPVTETLQADIFKKGVTLNLTAGDKVYDGNADAELGSDYSFDTLIAGDEVTASWTSASFADKNVGAGKAVTVTGLAYGGADKDNYEITVAPVTASITPKAVTLNLSAEDKEYDGTTDAAINSVYTFDTLVAGDEVTASWTSASFADKNVGEDKAVSVAGLTYGGADAGNYTITLADMTADIAAKDLTVKFTAESREYDGSTDAVISGYDLEGLVAGDDVTVTVSSGTFADKNVGTDKAVTVSDYSIDGDDVDNYNITAEETTAASITAKAVTLNLSAEDKEYNADTAATLKTNEGDYSFDTLIDGDVVTVDFTNASATFADKNVGEEKAVSVTGLTYGGADAGNYEITLADVTADITPKAITVNFTADEKVYDGTTAATITDGYTFVTLYDGDVVTVTGAVAEFANKNAGTGKQVNVSDFTLGGADAGNYTVTLGTATGTITPKAIELNFTAEDKNFDGNDTATVTDYAFVTLISGDEVTVDLDAVTALFDTPAWGEDKTVTVTVPDTAYGGADKDNYTYTVNTTTASILGPEDASTVVTIAEDIVDPFDNEISLREALTVYFKKEEGAEAVYDSQTGTFSYADDTANSTITFKPGLKVIDPDAGYELGDAYDYNNLVIEGDDRIVFEGEEFQIFTITEAADITFNGLTFKNNVTDADGAAISIADGLTGDKTVTISDSDFLGNTAEGGGAIYAGSLNVVVDGGLFSDNEATASGGAIYNAGAALTITDGEFIYNTAAADGGAIYTATDLTIADGTFSRNSAASGGAVYGAADTTLTVTDSVFSRNTASENGGAVYGDTVISSESLYGSNSATVNGGAIYGGHVETTDDTFTRNTATGDGGAIYSDSADTVISDGSIFSANSAANGGAIYGITVTVTDGQFTNNKVLGEVQTVTEDVTTTETEEGYFADPSGEYVFDTWTDEYVLPADLADQFVYNAGTGQYVPVEAGDYTYDWYGGEYVLISELTRYSWQTVTTTTTTTVTSQQFVGGSGGAIYGTNLTITDSGFASNTANVRGGAVYGTSIDVIGSTFTNNKAVGITETVTEEVPVTVTVVDYEYDVNGDYVWGYFRTGQENEEYFAIADLTKYSYDTATSSYVEDENGTFIHELDYNMYYDLSNPNPTYTQALRRSRQVITTVEGSGTETITHEVTTGGDGGAILASSTLSVTDSDFTSNSAAARGGALYGVTITVSGGDFTKNSAGSLGGAIYGLGESDVTITDSEFVRNSANHAGAVFGSKLTVTGSSFRNNSAVAEEGYGGAIYANSEGSAVSVSGSSFESNTAAYGGAFVAWPGGTVTFTETAFTGNSASRSGGAVYVEDTESLTLNKVVFDKNTAGHDGGAVYAVTYYNDEDAISIIDSTFTGNETINKGGAIRVQDGSVLEISGTLFDGNKAAGAYSEDEQNWFGGEGGAIYYGSGSIDHITINDSRFTDNQASVGDGGALRVFGGEGEPVTINRSLFRGNSAAGSGGAIQTTSIGLTVNYSWIVENTAGSTGGGIDMFKGSGVIYQSLVADNTAAGNGGGIYLYDKASLNISWSTVAGNSGAAGPDLYVQNNVNTAQVTASYSILLDAELSTQQSVLNTVNSLYGTVVANGGTFNPDADSQQYHTGDILFAGGGDVMTAYYLADRSVAVNGTGLTTGHPDDIDLAGRVRPYATYYDYGAYEWQGGGAGPETPSMIVTTDRDVVDPWDYQISLREALTVYYQTDGTFTYNEETGTDFVYGKDLSNTTVMFMPNLGTMQVDGEGFTLTSTHDGLVIEGEGRITFDGETFRIFTITEAADMTFNGLTFKNLSTAVSGSAIGTTAALTGSKTLTINDGVFENNASTASGGAICVDGLNLTISGGTFTGNTSGAGGGAIYSANNSLTVSDDTLFENNTAANNGGAILSSNDPMTITGGVFRNNSAANGGAIYGSTDTITITGTEFTGNTATGHSGAIASTSGTLSLTDAVFTNNTAGSYGGAVYGSGTVTINDSTFTSNSTGSYAGALMSAGQLTVSGSTFASNTTGARGGAIWVYSGSAAVNDSTFTGNKTTATVSYGGAISGNGDSTITVDGSTFTDNSTSGVSSGSEAYGGGAIFGASGAVSVTDTVFDANKSGRFGGAIYAYSSAITVSGSTFTGNTAESRGGAVFTVAGSITVDESEFTGNRTAAGGYGGALGAYSTGGAVTVTDSEFANNSSTYGGAVLGLGTITIDGSTFTGNTGLAGGAVANLDTGLVKITNSDFTDNHSSYFAGVIYGMAIDISESNFENNSTTGSSGGVILAPSA